MFKLNFHLTKATLLYAKKKLPVQKKKSSQKVTPNRSNFPSLILWEVMKISESQGRLAACEWKISRSMPVSFGQHTPNCNNVVIRK